MFHRSNHIVFGDPEVGLKQSARKKTLRGALHIAGIGVALSTAACAGGGGTSSMTSSGGSTAAGTGSCSTCVGIPAAASFGPSPVPFQFATSGGPTLNGGNGIYPAPNTAFPALSSSLQLTSNGLQPVANQGATLTFVSASTTSATYQISVPSIGVNSTLQIPLLANNELSYVALGNWQQPAASGVSPGFTEWVFGYQTPATSMPTTGTASFAGSAEGTVFTPGTTIAGTSVSGVSALSVNFASGSITGALTQMQYINPANPGTSSAPNFLPWNDVSLNATIAAGTSQFSGSTAVTSSTQSPLALKSSATGVINGNFYGPSAQSLAGIWSLSDGTNSILGSVVANH